MMGFGLLGASGPLALCHAVEETGHALVIAQTPLPHAVGRFANSILTPATCKYQAVNRKRVPVSF